MCMLVSYGVLSTHSAMLRVEKDLLQRVMVGGFWCLVVMQFLYGKEGEKKEK